MIDGDARKATEDNVANRGGSINVLMKSISPAGKLSVGCLCNRGRSMQRAFVFAAVLFSYNAFGWAHLLSLSQGLATATLTSTSLSRHAINFCISTVSDGTALIDDASIDRQVRLVIKMWLEPARELIGSDVPVYRVSCEDRQLSLKITLRADTSSTKAASTYARIDGTRRYEEILIRTNYRSLSQGEAYPIVDFAWIAKQINVSPGNDYSEEDAVRYADEHRLTAFDIARLAHVNSLVSFNSSYNILLHEMGHAFGLCDLYEPALSQQCDKQHASNPISVDSVMREGGYLSLQPDDRDGIRSLFARYRGDRSRINRSNNRS